MATADREVVEPAGAQATVALRDGLLALLTLAAGYVDALAYLRLGQVFAMNMTGNAVLISVAAGRGDVHQMVRSSLAFVAFALGVFVSARIAGRGRGSAVWPASVTAVLGAELVLLALFAGGWWWVGGQVAAAEAAWLLALAAAAMGMQSAAALRLGVPGVSTTYITGTLTILMAELAALAAARSGWVRHALVLVALIVGAALAALVVWRWPPAAAIVPAAVLALVTAVGALRLQTVAPSPPDR